ncbi:MAG: phosphate ABC transporter permease subunit PstC, partial [Solirubrobacteraceae bacterium]
MAGAPNTPQPAMGGGGSGPNLLRTRTPRSIGESAIRLSLFVAAAISVITTTLIVLSLLRETVAFFGDVGITEFLFGTKWTPQLAGEQQSFGMVPVLLGTLYITGIAMLVAVPLGLLAAIYLSE